MSYKHLLVHIDGGERSLERVDLSVVLARRFGARLTGLFAEGQEWGPTLHRSKPRHYGKDLKAAAALFESKVREASLQSDWWRVADREMDVGGIAARFCRYVDLAILGQPDPDDERVPRDFASQVLLESGHPVLLVPAFGHYPSVGTRVIVAWDGSRESARALTDALPIMAGADKVVVLELEARKKGRRASARSLADVVAHLQAHGLSAERQRVVVSDEEVVGSGIGVLDEVLNVSSDLGADLVVMGARGRHGVPFPRAGRATRKSLQSMTAPMLLSH